LIPVDTEISSYRNENSVIQNLNRETDTRMGTSTGHHPSLRPSSLIEHPPTPTRRQLTLESQQQQQQQDRTRDDFLPHEVDRYDRIWGDMTARMGDLDTLAAKRATDTPVASEVHSEPVERLREAQIRLVETWAASESRLSQSSLLEKLAKSAAGFRFPLQWN
jgi:Disordered region of unknown function (DUF5315)